MGAVHTPVLVCGGQRGCRCLCSHLSAAPPPHTASPYRPAHLLSLTEAELVDAGLSTLQLRRASALLALARAARTATDATTLPLRCGRRDLEATLAALAPQLRQPLTLAALPRLGRADIVALAHGTVQRRRLGSLQRRQRACEATAVGGAAEPQARAGSSRGLRRAREPYSLEREQYARRLVAATAARGAIAQDALREAEGTASADPQPRAATTWRLLNSSRGAGATVHVRAEAGWQPWTPLDAPIPSDHPAGLSCEKSWLRPGGGGGVATEAVEVCLLPRDHITRHVQRHGRWRDCGLLVDEWERSAEGRGAGQGASAGEEEAAAAAEEGTEGEALFVEVGANVGVCTLELLLRTKASVLALEPSAVNLFHLTRSLRWAARRWPELAHRVAVLPLAAGALAVDNASVVARRGNYGGSSVIGGGGGRERPRGVEAGARASGVALPTRVRALDALLPQTRSRPPPSVRLMKVDTQGAECAVLAGAVRLLMSGRVASLVTEVTPRLLTAHGCGEGHLRWLLGRAGFAVANFSYLLGSRLVAAATRPAVASLPANAEINWVARAIRY